MCLSAPVSFTASAVLAAVGTALVCRIQSKRLLPLALIPFFFAVQQLAEGIVWLYLSGGPHPAMREAAKDVFVFFAYIFWPLWVPASLWAVERNSLRKQILAACFGIALALVSFLICLIPHVEAAAYRFSIHYLVANESQYPLADRFRSIGVFYYAVAALLPLFVSTLKRAWVLGICVTVAGIAIHVIDNMLFVSLWCFFSALISISLFFILPKDLSSARREDF